MNWKFWETKNTVVLNDYGTTSNPILTGVWDGEKTPGELGAVYDTMPDHLKLKLRAYDMDLKTDIIKVITGKFFKWVIGSGLKLQAEPNETVLEMSGIKEDLPRFNKEVEALFNLYSSSNYSDYHRKDWLHEKANEAFRASFFGDCLCIIRFDNFGPNMQVIDGQQVESPLDEDGKGKGNKIVKGIEINEKGEHIAFWIYVGDLKHKRVESRNNQGMLVAWMIYGDKHRIDHQRGIPRIASILEKVSKLDRFSEASVSKAEQVANVVFAFEHDATSTGTNILSGSLSSKKSTEVQVSPYEKGELSAAQMRQSTSNQVFNLTPGSKLSQLSTQSETTFNEFFRAVFVVLCAAVDIPEEVALQKYEQNYSSSRAAINGWEYIAEIHRKRFAKKFYEPFYRCWLEFNILNGTIKSNGFLKAKSKGQFMAIEAYFNARFMGKKMPHIDPLKEAKAVRAMLGNDDTPLISNEQATEAVGYGDWNENYKKYLEEDKQIIKDEPEITNNSNNGNVVK